MATIKGVWIFNDKIITQSSNKTIITNPNMYYYALTASGYNFVKTKVASFEINDSTCAVRSRPNNTGSQLFYYFAQNRFEASYWNNTTKTNSIYLDSSDLSEKDKILAKTIIIESDDDIDETTKNIVYEFLTVNAKKLQTVDVTYNGNTIASIEPGITATLNCAGKKMATDISITAPEVAEANLQEKTITENGEVVPDEGYDGFSKVVVDVPIPDGYIIPTGTKEITENGTHDVTEFASATINIPIPVVEMYDGTVTMVKLINFTIDGTSYQAEEGMTWTDWYVSKYNTAGFTTSINYDSGLVNPNSGYFIKYEGSAYILNSEIIEGYSYITEYENTSGGTND